jgi:BASS family bile acid:Na+ symporter
VYRGRISAEACRREWRTLPFTSTSRAVLDRLTRAFPLWVVAAAAIALIEPPLLTWFTGPLLTWGLGLVMLGMGLTLDVADFARVAQAPVTVATGLVLRCTVMPALGWAMGYAFSLAAVVTIALIVGSILGAGRDEVVGAGLRLVGAVGSLHVGGFALGYVLARLVRRTEIAARTISIEVGMQNPGLGVVLARQHFASPLVAIPCAISSLAHSVLGSVLATWWRRSAG